MKIEIEFFTYWHCGSGSSGGSRVDALVAKDNNGLPYIPAKTLKGHIREMAESLDDCTFVNECFGGSSNDGKDGKEKDVCYDEKYRAKEGKCYFSNAIIEEKIDKKLSSYLFTTISSTKIDEKGLAVDGSLREIEAVVPLKLYATIAFDDGVKEEYKETMKKAFSQVKRMGLNRTRGLGRCEITLAGESHD
jgi:CRISPR/Cas system CSM-associated protein Csm3 (group 7 of RAMP superfamily)